MPCVALFVPQSVVLSCRCQQVGRGGGSAADASLRLHAPALQWTQSRGDSGQAGEVPQPGAFLYYKKPLNIVEGKMQYLFEKAVGDIWTPLQTL